MHVKYHKTCRICGNRNLTEVIDLGYQHIQGAFEHQDSETPPRRKVSNRIVRCDTSKEENACGLIQAEVSVSPEILYRNYWYKSGVSQTMRGHLKSIVDEALEIVKPYKDTVVVDIGMNDGTLLRNYPDHFRRIGIDPSNIAAQQKDLEVINEVFPVGLDVHADIITSIACFYDVNDPIQFVRAIKNMLKPNGIWIFEVAYWKSMVENLAFDQILTEHAVHYHLAPIEYLLEYVGLKLFFAKKTSTNGGSIMCYVTRSSCAEYDTPERKKALRELRFEEFDAYLDDNSRYLKFKDDVLKSGEQLFSFLAKERKNGKTVHLYGASTKMNTILQAFSIQPPLIEYAAERSPEKFGAKTLSGIKIISEEESRAMKPDYYLCSLVGFKDEILKREKEFLKNGGKFIFPLPELEVIGNED
ncbi:MAG: hypothetical protein FMNOHCHN_03400 [Ignavibacteriaceae bacterium]|nr:hypothetical protein [Ignavibacteriaceae bacterium]